MMNRLFYTACCLLFCGVFSAQAQHNTPNLHKCGTSFDDDYQVRERMFENRRNSAQIMANRNYRSGDSIVYIPIQFHLIAQANGSGRATVEQMFDNLCKINSDYEDQNIQFYLAGPANFINNTSMYINDDRSLTGYMMDLLKVDGVVNIFVGQSINNFGGIGTTLGYYTPQYDCIYAIRSQLTASSETLTHELGHFFTLAHPFFGWDGQDPNDVIGANGGTTPLGIGNVTVENVARGTNDENCQWAADGFCDTKPNYNFGIFEPTCGLTIGPFYDPLGVELETPDSDNYMSYYGESCTNAFTNEQKQAIILDVVQRGYDRFEVPKIDITSAPSIVWPTQSEPPHYFQSFDLQWTAATGATYYHVIVRRYIGGSPGPVVVDEMVTGTSMWVSLDPNTSYGWTVKPVNSYDLDCSNQYMTPVTQFTTGSWLSDVQETDVTIESSRLFPNPADKNAEVVLEINSNSNATAQISIYNALGQAVMPAQETLLVSGTNTQLIDVSMLSAGMYIVNIETQEGRISHKLVLND